MIKSPSPGDAKSARSHAAQKPANTRRVGVAAARELRETVRLALADLFGKFLGQLPAALIETAGSATNLAEQRACQDLARSLAANTGRWIEVFIQQVDARLVGGNSASHGKSTGAQSAADESIVLANLELRAEELHYKAISALDAQLDRIRTTLYVPLYAKALAPAGLCRALQETADVLGWPASQRRVLFLKFDDLAVGELRPWYNALLEALKRVENTAVKAAVDAAAAAAAAPAEPVAPLPVAATEPPKQLVDQLARTQAIEVPIPSQVDSNTISMLQAHALKAGTDGYDDGALAADLLALTDSKPVPGVEQDQSWVPLQRIALAGHFLNDAIADPFVPEEMKPQHESVRFPLVKSALTDSTLFTTATHPLGSLINELMLKAATARITGNAETRRLAELLQQVLVQFDLAPEFVRQAMRAAKPIEETQIQRFFELQRQQAQQRRDFVIGEAKRLVIRELERSTFGRKLSAPAVRFLNATWGPLLTKRLLQYGAAHDQWKSALALMEELLDQLDGKQTDEGASAAWQKLMKAMEAALSEEGLEAERAAEAFAALKALRPVLK